MQIIKAFPPNIDQIRKHLPKVADTMVFTWGYVIYTPSGYQLEPGLIRHEQHHADQQAEYGTQSVWGKIVLPRYRIQKWWKRYLEEPAFRLSQEIPAYQLQYREYKKVVKDKNKLNRLAVMLAKDLSSPFYGNIMSTTEAVQAITREEL